jgi:protein-arginine kinase activator protein McsA
MPPCAPEGTFAALGVFRPPAYHLGKRELERAMASPDSTPGKAPANETPEQKAERERRELERRRKELEERLEREKYERDDM